MPYSADASGMRSSRFSSFSACFSASSGHAGLVDRLAQLGDLGLALVAFAELLLNLAKLLAQDVLALPPGKRLSASARRSASTGATPRSAGRDSAAACRAARRRRRSPARPASRLRRQVGDVGDEVGELRRRLHLLDRAGDLGRHVGQAARSPRARAPSADACARRSRWNRLRPRRPRRRGRRGYG